MATARPPHMLRRLLLASRSPSTAFAVPMHASTAPMCLIQSAQYARDNSSPGMGRDVATDIMKTLKEYHESFAIDHPQLAALRHTRRESEEKYIQQADSGGPANGSKLGDADAFASARVPRATRSIRPLPDANYVLTVLAGRHNTQVSLGEFASGKTLVYHSGGTVGFKDSKRRGFDPAFQAATKVFEAARDIVSKPGDCLPPIWLRFKGYNIGRDAVWRALTQFRWPIAGVEDATPIAYGGCRPKKRRRT